jgi:hypothetical protein
LISSNGGADGVRTRDLIDAIDARSQLRYGPTVVRLETIITLGSRSVKPRRDVLL